MLSIGQQKSDPLALAVLAVFGAGAVVTAILLPDMTVGMILALTAAAAVVYCALKWEITLWTWLWVLSYGLLDRGFWHFEATGFFNLTIPRIIFVVATAAYAMYFILRGRTVNFDRPIFWWLLVLIAFSAISATANGWSSPDPEFMTPPYYRFIGGLVFPVIMFVLMYNCVRTEKQYVWGLMMLSLFGWYAIYIAYLQYFDIRGLAPGLRQFIWPDYINDPEYGIHFARSRGPFVGAGPQAMFMVVVFYGGLYLLKQVRGPYRIALVAQVLLAVPAVFFTGLRSGYVCFIAGGVIWVFLSGRRPSMIKLLSLLLALGLVTWGFWDNLSQTDRASGGVAQVSPLRDRLALAKITWTITTEHPWTGVGYGRFAEARHAFPRDPTVRWLPASIVQHNIFLNALAETGLVGLILMMVPFIILFRESHRLYRKLPREAVGPLSRGGVVLFWVFLANYLISGMFVDVTMDFFNTNLLWAMAGLMVGYRRQLEAQPIDLPAGVSSREPSGAVA